ncbi:sugar transferase [Candidatus Campbellbacteria bacterium]|nr:MAG: sugar transferase [Candidatus Campbellbacteria bacterium]
MPVGKIVNRSEALILFLGDVLVLYFSLWVTLFLRRFEIPDMGALVSHFQPFTILFVLWLLVFFIAGLYDKHTTFLKKRIPSIILNAQVVNSILGIFFFYFIPYFGITPKTTLFIFLVVSFVCVVIWRRNSVLFFESPERQAAILIGSGNEMDELKREVNSNPRYGIFFASSIDLSNVSDLDFQKEIIERMYSENITTIVVDTKHENVVQVLPKLYNLMFSGVRFVDMHKVYEDIFDRVPLSLVQYSWFLENISATRKFTYEFLKRGMDILIALPLLVVSLILFPFVYFAIRFEDGGSMFISQDRVGKNNHTIRIFKVRTMTGSDSGNAVLASKYVVTKTGKILRTLRIDELPQLWNVLRGDISLIGPRPEFPAMVKLYEQEVPFYNVRHLIKPGLSGWAQIYHENHPHHGTDVGETRVKLSYDLYYIKNRNITLDLKIALKTVKTILSRAGI